MSIATIKLKDLNIEQLRELYQKNLKFSIEIYDAALDRANDDFINEVVNTFGNRRDSLVFDDCYGVSRLRVRDEVQFIKDIDSDYLWEEVAELYKEAKKSVDAYENLEYQDSAEADKCWETVVDLVSKLAEEMNNTYKKIQQNAEAHFDEVFQEIIDGVSYMSNWEKHTDSTVTYTVTHYLR